MLCKAPVEEVPAARAHLLPPRQQPVRLVGSQWRSVFKEGSSKGGDCPDKSQQSTAPPLCLGIYPKTTPVLSPTSVDSRPGSVRHGRGARGSETKCFLFVGLNDLYEEFARLAETRLAQNS